MSKQTTWQPPEPAKLLAALILLYLLLVQLLACNTVKRTTNRTKTDSVSVQQAQVVTVVKRDTVNEVIREIEYQFMTDTIHRIDTVYLPGIGRVISAKLRSVSLKESSTQKGNRFDSTVSNTKDSTKVAKQAKQAVKESKRPSIWSVLILLICITAIIVYIGERKPFKR